MGLNTEGGTNETALDSAGWREDILGSNYQNLTIPLGSDPDNETDVYATLVRHLPEGTDLAEFLQRPALLWIHGMTDYFFHTEFAEFFHSQGYAIYALDLRKCGRSHRPGQLWHYVSDLSYYFPDLNAATDIITAQHHPAFFPVAHSTGGLITPLWLDHMRKTAPDRHAQITGLILNSPWLDMMHPPRLVKAARPVINWLGRRQPLRVLPSDGLGTYGRSIHRDHEGEWNFDVTLKPIEGHRKNVGWLRAIMAGHVAIHRDTINVDMDVLTLCSATSYLTRKEGPEIHSNDAVLDVEHIKKWSPHLSRPGSRVTVRPLDGARHDVFLSLKPVREQAQTVMLDWLKTRGNDHTSGLEHSNP
ncbi:alpha/beta hydrolase [uncultured Corynebacterium sp.]|uniref:alpha/beta hydrolase n=1 Tax=uncultured Corynebacterium sp. TaxID=159447 RepID=UPI0025F1B1DA|nr:alpha/beta hydrolase [uncultured Corynebacterium sp.]